MPAPTAAPRNRARIAEYALASRDFLSCILARILA